jgi:hypothetical protein
MRVSESLNRQAGPSPKHIEKRVSDLWSQITKTKVQAEYSKGDISCLCPELAALRLFYYYNKTARDKKTKMGYSTNLKSWYFILETNL